MTFLGTKHSKPQQRGVLSGLQADHLVRAPRAGLHRPLQDEPHQPVSPLHPPRQGTSVLHRRLLCQESEQCAHA